MTNPAEEIPALVGLPIAAILTAAWLLIRHRQNAADRP